MMASARNIIERFLIVSGISVRYSMCEYCEDKRTFIRRFGEAEFAAQIHDNTLVSRIGNYVESKIYIDEINYCPMCGKKLKH